jgi:hypothetical protein
MLGGMPQVGVAWLSDPVFDVVRRIADENNQAIPVTCAELIREAAERWERRERRRRNNLSDKASAAV